MPTRPEEIQQAASSEFDPFPPAMEAALLCNSAVVAEGRPGAQDRVFSLVGLSQTSLGKWGLVLKHVGLCQKHLSCECHCGGRGRLQGCIYAHKGISPQIVWLAGSSVFSSAPPPVFAFSDYLIRPLCQAGMAEIAGVVGQSSSFAAGVCQLWHPRCSWSPIPISPCQHGRLVGIVVHEHLGRQNWTPLFNTLPCHGFSSPDHMETE
uniref:Uncharacterized protein n=1 Tax=Sphaerodactylus townsendi TaxID=933632 RepID=A0ACB8F1C6_9SAUR